MSKDTTKVTLGSGDLYLNNVEVGHLKGDVTFEYAGETLDFKPANVLGVVKRFAIKELATLTASLAEVKAANMKLALGITTAVDVESDSVSYDPSSYDFDGSSWNVVRFGGNRTISEISLRFEHTRPDGKKIILVLYKATSNRKLTLPFKEEDFTLQDLVFTGLNDATRTEGDQIGFVAEEL